MIHSLPIGPVRVGVISFSFTADVEFKLDTFTDKTAMGNKVNGLTWKNSWTHTPQALERARTIIFQSSAGDRPSIRNYAVVLTDGEPKLDQVQDAKMLQDTFDQAAQLRGSGVEIFAIGVGKSISMNTLEKIAADKNNVFLVDFDGLGGVMKRILADLCGYTSESVRQANVRTHAPTLLHIEPPLLFPREIYQIKICDQNNWVTDGKEHAS